MNLIDSEIRDRAGCELAAEAIHAGGQLRLRVMGTSMLPAVWPGDILTVRNARDSILEAGEIVLFYRDGRLWAHRIVGWVETAGSRQILTRGDALDECDPPVHRSELLGSVVAISRRGKLVASSATHASRSRGHLSTAMRRSGNFRRLVLSIHAARTSLWAKNSRRLSAARD